MIISLQYRSSKVTEFCNAAIYKIHMYINCLTNVFFFSSVTSIDYLVLISEILQLQGQNLTDCNCPPSILLFL
jgi:hypothetical protein